LVLLSFCPLVSQAREGRRKGEEMSNEAMIKILRFAQIGFSVIGFILAALALWRTATEDKRKIAREIIYDNTISRLKFEIGERARKIAREIKDDKTLNRLRAKLEKRERETGGAKLDDEKHLEILLKIDERERKIGGAKLDDAELNRLRAEIKERKIEISRKIIGKEEEYRKRYAELLRNKREAKAARKMERKEKSNERSDA